MKIRKMKKLFFVSLLAVFASTLLINCANTSKTKDKTSKDLGSKTEPSSTGINFQDLSFEESLKQAKKKNKLIFIDAYASWCGPCKMLDKNTFPDPSLGTYFNDKFINLKIDCEKHPDGRSIQNKYGVSAYPTMIWVDGDGVLVKKVVGYRTAEQLLKEVPFK